MHAAMKRKNVSVPFWYLEQSFETLESGEREREREREGESKPGI